jgi:homoserine dehydrogenase
MANYKLVFFGFGNVGRALARLLLCKRDELDAHHGVRFTVVGIKTGGHGGVIEPEGLDLAEAARLYESGGSLEDMADSTPPEGGVEFIRACGGDVLFENTPVDYARGQPAVDHLRAALTAGMHAITANKGPVVHAYQELKDLARERRRRFYFESTVMDGAPIFSLFREALPGARLRSFRGVLNSTTNLILTRMEGGERFEEAVAYAQSVGIAETDPGGDVDGWDAAIKVAALVTVLMGVPLKPDQVDRLGIRGITQEAVSQAVRDGERWKLVCTAARTGDGVEARVAPERVPPSSPLYGVSGTTSIAQFETDVLGNLSVVEEDPGPHTTAYGLLADFLNAVKGESQGTPLGP